MIGMKHGLILFWVGYFMSIGLTDHICGIVTAVALSTSAYPSDNVIAALYAGAVGLSCGVMWWVMRSHQVFWSLARHQIEALGRQNELQAKRFRDASR